MKYQIGKSYKVAMYDVEIIDSFKSYINKDTDEIGIYYIIRIMPDNLITVITETSLDLKNITRYVPTIADRTAAKGNIDIYKYQKTYTMWRDMVYRCTKKNSKLYLLYGAQGVTVHPKWWCYEYFQVDLFRIPGASQCLKDKSKTSYVIDFTNEVINTVPLNNRQYRLGTCYITKFYGSNIMYDNQYIKTNKDNNYTQQKQSTNSKPYGFLSGNGKPVQTQPYMAPPQQTQQPMYDNQGRLLQPPTQEEYMNMLQDTSFMDKYPKLDPSKAHEVWPVKVPIEPVMSHTREPGQKIMCVIVPKGSKRTE